MHENDTESARLIVKGWFGACMLFGVEAGFELTSGIVRNNKEAMAELTAIFNGRHKIRKELTPIVLATSVPPDELRKLGWQFRQKRHTQAQLSRRKPIQSAMDWAVGFHPSSTPDASSEDIIRWLAHMTAHAAFDMQCPAQFEKTMEAVLGQLGHSPYLCNRIAEHKEWLITKRHARHAWDASKCSAKVVETGRKLQGQELVAFLVLMYFAINSERFIEHWSQQPSHIYHIL